MNRTVTMLAMSNLPNELGVRTGATRLIRFIEQFDYEVSIDRIWDGQPASLPETEPSIVRLCRIQSAELQAQNARRCAELGHLCIIEEDGAPCVVRADGSICRDGEEYFTRIVDYLEKRADRLVRLHRIA